MDLAWDAKSLGFVGRIVARILYVGTGVCSRYLWNQIWSASCKGLKDADQISNRYWAHPQAVRYYYAVSTKSALRTIGALSSQHTFTNTNAGALHTGG